MGRFTDSVKELLGQVFGKADFEHVLKDHWDFADSFPEDQRIAMQARPADGPQRKGRGKGKARKLDRTRPMPAPPLPIKKIEIESVPRIGGVDLAMFTGGDDEAEPEVKRLEIKVTAGAPHRADVSADIGVADLPFDDGLGLFGGADSPYPADPYADLEEADVPPALDTLAITGDFQAPESEPAEARSEGAAAPVRLQARPAAMRLERVAAPESGVAPPKPEAPPEEEPVEVAAPPVRLVPVPPPSPDPAADSLGDMLGDDITCASMSGSQANLSISRRPKARVPAEHGPPPESIWDERAVRDAVIADLKQEGAKLADRGARRVLDLLRAAVDTEPLHLPPFPAAAQRLMGRNGLTATDDEVLEVVRSEPTLAGNVVKVANSPFYMAAVPVASLNAAVMRIGLDQVRRVSLAAVVGSSWDVEGFRGPMARMRLHCHAAAVAAESLAGDAGVEPGEAFLAGLLHDAGEALAYRLVRVAAEKATKRGKSWEPDGRLMRKVARRHHQRLGALFLGGWDLAASVAAAMSFHHHPELAEPRFADLVRLIHVADAIAYRGLAHARSRPWRESLMLRAPGATREELDRAVEVDGIAELDVDDLLFQAPRRTDPDRLRGIVRSMLLRLDSSELASLDGGDAFTDTYC